MVDTKMVHALNYPTLWQVLEFSLGFWGQGLKVFRVWGLRVQGLGHAVFVVFHSRAQPAQAWECSMRLE